MSFYSVFHSSESQRQWTAHMNHNYIRNSHVRPCVFQVPNSLKEVKPEAYVPQRLGLGPYHHFSPELQFIEIRKRDAVRDYLHITDHSQDFIGLINEHCPGFAVLARSFYDRYLDLDKNTLECILVLDCIFLLHFIDTYLSPGTQKDLLYFNIEKWVPDVFMLENQIPFVLILELRKLPQLSFNFPQEQVQLFEKFHRFCRIHSPLQLAIEAEVLYQSFDRNNHLLHFMYQMTAKNRSPRHDFDCCEPRVHRGTWISKFVQEVAHPNGEIFRFAMEEFKYALTAATNPEPGNVQEVAGDNIEIPSVSRLIAIANIKFRPLPDRGGIGDITLVERNLEFYLPVIRMRANSEAILCNLVAYEAAISKEQESNPISDYVRLMCGLIKSETDVCLLRDAKIINSEVTDQEIVRICSELKKSVGKPDEESVVHIIVKDMNDQFNNARIAKFLRWLFKGIADAVKYFKILVWIVRGIMELVTLLKPLIPILAGVFIGFGSACGIFDCQRKLDHGGRAAAAMENLRLDNYLESSAKFMLPRKLLPYQSM